ncbi:Rnf-Nqr protein [Synechococcus phage S-BM3]|nr:Rnf-Nqr protein [Synechococcus phage S-BM3]
MWKLWRIWAKALGAKEGKNDREADIIACIRTAILMCYMVTNVAIVANAMRHWNNVDKPSESTLESSVTCPKP